MTAASFVHEDTMSGSSPYIHTANDVSYLLREVEADTNILVNRPTALSCGMQFCAILRYDTLVIQIKRLDSNLCVAHCWFLGRGLLSLKTRFYCEEIGRPMAQNSHN